MSGAGPGRGEAARFRLLAVGVGGQGVLTVTGLLGRAALAAGLEAVVGQLHGMSQRGGSVESTLLIGAGRSSFLEDGKAQVLLAFEPLEALRARPRLGPSTRVLLSTGRIVPPVLAQKGAGYPPLDEIRAGIRAVAGALIEVDGPLLAARAGSARALNMVLLGALSALDVLPFPADHLERSLLELSPPGWREANARAFALGRETVGRAAAERIPRRLPVLPGHAPAHRPGHEVSRWNTR